MNNAKLVLDKATLQDEPEIDKKPWLANESVKIMRIIEAIQAIKSSSHWKFLKENLFDGEVEALWRNLGKEKDPTKLHTIQGQLAGVIGHTDLDKLEKEFRLKLEEITSSLKQ